MKRIYAGVVVAGLLALTGCGGSSSTGGGGATGGTFKFSTDKTGEVNLTQGDTTTVKLDIKKEGTFSSDVDVKATVTPPMGVTVDLSPTVWKANDPKPISVNIKADEKADVTKYTVLLTGTPTKAGKPVEYKLTVDVKKKG